MGTVSQSSDEPVYLKMVSIVGSIGLRGFTLCSVLRRAKSAPAKRMRRIHRQLRVATTVGMFIESHLHISFGLANVAVTARTVSFVDRL